MAQLRRLVRVRVVELLEAYRVRIVFEDDTQGEVDLEPYLHGPIFGPRCVSVDEG
jgi:hypothetical protein